VELDISPSGQEEEQGIEHDYDCHEDCRDDRRNSLVNELTHQRLVLREDQQRY